MAGAEFRYVTTNLYQAGTSANPIIAELPFTGVNFTSQLNSVGTFQGHVLLSGINSSKFNIYEGTIPAKTILWVLYTDPVQSVSVPVWSGIIWSREYNSANQTLSITAQEMMSLYNRRRISTTKDYSVNISDPDGYDPAYIAKQLMQYAEGLSHGSTGLDYNTLNTSFRTKKIYYGYELKSVYQAVKDLAANYFDFKIQPLVSGGDLINRFTLGYPLGTEYSANDLLAPVFQFPGNLVEYKFPEDGSGAVNTLYGLGYGDNNTRVGAKAVDPSKVGTYTITNAVGNGTQITFTSANRFIAGQQVFVQGITPSQYNATYVIDSVTPGALSTDPNVNFKVLSTTTGTYSSGGVAKSVWPLLEDTANYIDIGDAKLLQDTTLGQVKAISYPPTTIEVVIPPYVDPYYTTYNIGQQVRLDIQDDYFPTGFTSLTLRIVAISVSPGENGPSRITLTLTRLLSAGGEVT